MTKKDELKLTLENPPQYAIGDEYLGLTDEIKKQEDDIKNIGDFKGTYSEQIDKKVADYLGRDKFNFNPNNSSTYQQIRNQYLGDGKRAMEDTLASGALLSGGYNNSAAQVAAQQTYNDYVKGVTDYIPKLEAEAYERHLNEGNQMIADINLMKGLDDSEYGKYIDDLNQKYQMLSHLTGMQQNYANLDANKNNFNQGNWSTILGAQENAAMHEDDMAIDERDNKQKLILAKMDALVDPTDEELKYIGWTRDNWNTHKYLQMLSGSSVSSGGGSGNSSGGGGNYTTTYLKQLYEDGDMDSFFSALSEKYGSDEESIIAGAQNLGLSEYEIRYLNDGTVQSLEQAQYLLKNFGKENYSDEQIGRMLSGAYTEDEFYLYGHRNSGYDTYEEYLTACFKRFIADGKVNKSYKSSDYNLKSEIDDSNVRR